MEFRHLGNSGLKVSAVSYGNWITHGSQLEAERRLRASARPWMRVSPPSTLPTCTRVDERKPYSAML
jgi:hypothetical protein